MFILWYNASYSSNNVKTSTFKNKQVGNHANLSLFNT